MAAEGRKSSRAESRITTDHQEIRNWVESRGGNPATVKRTHDTGEPGIIRIDFPGFKGAKSLERITWEEFFKQFDNRNLFFLYQEKTASGRLSRFNKIISRETVKETEKAKKAA